MQDEEFDEEAFKEALKRQVDQAKAQFEPESTSSSWGDLPVVFLNATQPRCMAEGKTGSGRVPSGPQTHRCDKPAGHELEAGNEAHEWRDWTSRRTVIWYGEAKKQEDDTRYRWGLRPGWQTR